MAATTRPLPGGLHDAITARLTRPFKLVRLVMPAPYGVRCYSTGPEVVFNGETYKPDLCNVGELSWDGDAQQSGQIELYNDETPTAAEMVINAGISEVPVSVYDAYHLMNDTTTAPVLVATGTLTDSDIQESSVVMTMVATTIAAEKIPNRAVTKQEGFNFLPLPGQRLQWGTETYIFEEDA